jgi:integrase
LEHPQYLALREALPEELRPVLTYGYCTGSRKAEVLGLRWEQVDLVERTVRLNAGETKNGEGRPLPLGPELVEALLMPTY